MKWVDPRIEMTTEAIVSAINTDVDPDVSFEKKDGCYIWTYHFKDVPKNDDGLGLWDDLYAAYRVVSDWLASFHLIDGNFEIRLFDGTLRLHERDGNVSLNTKLFSSIVKAISVWMWRRGMP